MILWLGLVVFLVPLVYVIADHSSEKRKRENELRRIQKRLAEKEREVSVPPDSHQRLLDRIGDVSDLSLPRPLVTLEEFFEGNNDYGSIGYNFYPDQPAPSEFWQVFSRIRDREDVFDVFVQIVDHEDIHGWPSTDTIWIVTNRTPEDVKQWLGERFRADDFLVGLPDSVEQVEIPDTHHAIGVWYD